VGRRSRRGLAGTTKWCGYKFKSRHVVSALSKSFPIDLDPRCRGKRRQRRSVTSVRIRQRVDEFRQVEFDIDSLCSLRTTQSGPLGQGARLEPVAQMVAESRSRDVDRPERIGRPIVSFEIASIIKHARTFSLAATPRAENCRLSEGQARRRKQTFIRPYRPNATFRNCQKGEPMAKLDQILPFASSARASRYS
jgi:hypothetical protein